MNLVKPDHTPEVTARHAIQERIIRSGQANIQNARATLRTILEVVVTAGIDDTSPMKLAILENEIANGYYKQNVDVLIIMTDSDKTQSRNEWRNYREINDQLKNHRGQGFSLFIGQSTQLLQDKMKQDTEWNVVSTSYDPMTLYRLVEKTFLRQWPLRSVD